MVEIKKTERGFELHIRKMSMISEEELMVRAEENRLNFELGRDRGTGGVTACVTGRGHGSVIKLSISLPRGLAHPVDVVDEGELPAHGEVTDNGVIISLIYTGKQTRARPRGRLIVSSVTLTNRLLW